MRSLSHLPFYVLLISITKQTILFIIFKTMLTYFWLFLYSHFVYTFLVFFNFIFFSITTLFLDYCSSFAPFSSQNYFFSSLSLYLSCSLTCNHLLLIYLKILFLFVSTFIHVSLFPTVWKPVQSRMKKFVRNYFLM